MKLGKKWSQEQCTKMNNYTSTGTLTLEDLERAVTAIREIDRKHQEWTVNLISKKSWQESNRLLTEAMSRLSNLEDSGEDYLTIYRCWLAIQPDSYHAVGPELLKHCKKILKKLKIK